ncbi:MAG: hypothetical protein C4523_15530 [Myxococcales bacterium]|nr:MAG: hypothetical protein C4523_15530 [Myxococcales bacterium]
MKLRAHAVEGERVALLREASGSEPALVEPGGMVALRCLSMLTTVTLTQATDGFWGWSVIEFLLWLR